MSEITVKAELKHKPYKSGLHQVMVRITQNKKHIRKVVKDVQVKKDEYSNVTGEWITSKNKNHKSFNYAIEQEIAKYKKQNNKLQEENQNVTKAEVFKAVNNVVLKQDFMSYYDLKVKELNNWNSEKIFNTTKNKIEDWHGKKPFDFSEMTPAWLKGFDKYLRETNNIVTLSIYMRKIKRVWNQAIDDDKVVSRDLYPFGKGKYQVPSTKKNKKQLERLTEAEIQSIFKCQYNNMDVYDSVDLKFYAQKGFLLSFLCAGIRAEDLFLLKWSNEKSDEFVYVMSKGVAKGKVKKFGINPQLKQILDDLRPENYKQDDFILPFLKKGIDKDKSKEGEKLLKQAISSATSVYNKCLKKIGKDIGTKKNMISHLARHSWAAIMYEMFHDLLMIQDNLDHEDIETTIGYIGQLTTQKNDEKLSIVYNAITDNKKTKIKKAA